MNQNNYEDDEYFALDEGFLDKSTFKLIKDWKTRNEKNRIKKFKSSSVTPEEASELKEEISIMRTDDIDYDTYKKAFHKFCTFIHTIDKGVILKTIKLDKNKNDENYTLYVEYADNTKKIKLPDDCKLYHISKVGGIRKLLPFFKGKSAKGYLYDKPRIYLTIRKKMPKFLADYKVNEKMYTYECKKDIKEVYVDPLVPSFVQGAVYIETQNPVDVEEVGMKAGTNDEEKVEAKNEAYEESLYDDVEFFDEAGGFDFDSFFESVMEFGLVPVTEDDEFIDDTEDILEDDDEEDEDDDDNAPVDGEDYSEEIGDEEEWEDDDEGLDVEDILPKSGMPSPEDVAPFSESEEESINEGLIPALLKKRKDDKSRNNTSSTTRKMRIPADDELVIVPYDSEDYKKRDELVKKMKKELPTMVNNLNKNKNLVNLLQDAIFEDLCPFDRKYMTEHPEENLPDPSKDAKARFAYKLANAEWYISTDYDIQIFDQSVYDAFGECMNICEKYKLMHDPSEYECESLETLTDKVSEILANELQEKLNPKDFYIMGDSGLDFIVGFDILRVKRYADIKNDKGVQWTLLNK